MIPMIPMIRSLWDNPAGTPRCHLRRAFDDFQGPESRWSNAIRLIRPSNWLEKRPAMETEDILKTAKQKQWYIETYWNQWYLVISCHFLISETGDKTGTRLPQNYVFVEGEVCHFGNYTFWCQLFASKLSPNWKSLCPSWRSQIPTQVWDRLFMTIWMLFWVLTSSLLFLFVLSFQPSFFPLHPKCGPSFSALDNTDDALWGHAGSLWLDMIDWYWLITRKWWPSHTITVSCLNPCLCWACPR